MNHTTIRTDYGSVLSETAFRLAREVGDAAKDGGWAATEAARLHAWVQADVVPWAKEATRDLDPRERASINPYIVAIAELDAQMLGTAGSSAAELADRLKSVVEQLVTRVRPQHANRAPVVPQQRDKAT